MKIIAYTGYSERNNKKYYNKFDIVDELPNVGDVIDEEEDYMTETVTRIRDVILDCEQGNDEVYNYNYFAVDTEEIRHEDEGDEIIERTYYYAIRRPVTYCIIDNEGNVHADNISSYSKAETMLNDIVSDIGEEEAEELELEIIEE